jgi:DNA-binding response OmpR family regulator
VPDQADQTQQDDVVSKPFRIPELVLKIEQLLARNNTAEPAAMSPLTPSADPME